uniref:AprE-like beta-barrel domain-containing protein n=1 Tax=uncultured Nostoc sp. TaxID=340711 RepID=A0A8F8FFG6_9NOSO|nr:hypothetical protein [uncultured Nostoc sp.]
MLGIFGATLVLIGSVKYKVIIKAPATIRPTGELRLVQSPTAGTIKSIAVQVNQVVKTGDIIALMDDQRLQIQKIQLQTNIQQATLQLSSIEAQIRSIDVQITAEKSRSDRSVASIQAELNRKQRDLQDKQITSVTQVKEVEANLKQVQKELQKVQAQLKSAQANLKSSEASLQAAIAKKDRYQPLVKNGSISQDQFQEVQLAVTQQQQLLEAQKASVEERQQAVLQQQQAVEAAKARLQGAYTTLNPSNADVAISQQRIAAESAIGKVSLEKLNQERQQLIQQKVEIQTQTNHAFAELRQINLDIANIVIRSPVSGIIQELALRNTSQVLSSGDIVAQISPDTSPLIIKALVQTRNIRQVEKGQEVQMRVFACPYTDFGILKGKVSAISPDVIPSIAKNATANYEVTIQPEKLVLIADDLTCTIQSGMEGRSDIISSQETVLKFLLRKARLMTNL